MSAEREELERLRAEFSNQGALTPRQELEQLRSELSQQTSPPDLTFGEKLKGTAEGVATLVSSAIAEPLAGISGLAGLAAETVGVAPQGFGAEQVEAVRDLLTFKPESREGKAAIAGLGEDLSFIVEPLQNLKSFLGDKAFEATGSEAIAGLLTALPDAFLLAPLVPRAPKVPQIKSRFPTEPTGAAVEAQQQQIATTLSKGSPVDIAKLVDADPAFFRAAEELGVTAEPLASFASKNPQFVAIEQGLASVPASALDVQTRTFITDLAGRADNLIERLGGTLDKGQLNIDFKRNAMETIDSLGKSADDVYGTLSKILPKEGRHPAPNTVRFIQEKAKELGGVDKLPSRLKGVLRDLSSKTTTKKGLASVVTGKRTATTEVINPTLGKIDQVRREVGQALNTRLGKFKDVESGLNKALYGNLAKDQEAIAVAGGFGEIAESAKGLIIQRKGLEENLVTLLGKDLNQALSVNVAGAVKGLAKNDIGRFNKVIDAIPKAQRPEIVLSALNDVFRGTGVGQQSLNPTQFVKWFENINRSPAVKKALFENLPKGTEKAVNNLFKVSSGISRALGNRVTTGRLNAMFNQETGFLRRMVGKAIPAAVGVATGSPIGAVATNATVEFLLQSTNGAKRASELLGSPQFQAIIRRSVSEGVVDGAKASAGLLKAEVALQKTKLFTQWRDTLSEAQRASLQSGGLVSYLFINELKEE